MCNSRNVANTTASVPMLAAKHNPGSCQAQLAPHMGCSAPAGTPRPASQGGDDTTTLTSFTRGTLMTYAGTSRYVMMPEVCSRRIME